MLDEHGAPLPALAQVAKQQGKHLGLALAANMLRGEAMPPFRFKNRGNTAVIGRNAAVFDFGNWRLKGWFGWLLWAIIHVYPADRIRKPDTGEHAVGVAVFHLRAGCAPDRDQCAAGDGDINSGRSGGHGEPGPGERHQPVSSGLATDLRRTGHARAPRGRRRHGGAAAV